MESNLAGINWVAVSEVFLASLFSLLVAFVLLFVREWYLGWSHRGRDERLGELAALRAQAIGTRNHGEIGPLTGQALTDWLSEAHAAEDGMIAKAYEVGRLTVTCWTLKIESNASLIPTSHKPTIQTS